jgi:hypothetical protein
MSIEMEFLDIIFSKDFCSMLLTIPFKLADSKENHTLLWFKNPYKKSVKQENSTYG